MTVNEWQSIIIDHLNDFKLTDTVSLLAQRCSGMLGKLDELADR